MVGSSRLQGYPAHLTPPIFRELLRETTRRNSYTKKIEATGVQRFLCTECLQNDRSRRNTCSHVFVTSALRTLHIRVASGTSSPFRGKYLSPAPQHDTTHTQTSYISGFRKKSQNHSFRVSRKLKPISRGHL